MFEKKFRLIFLQKEYSTMRIIKIVQTNEIKKSIRVNNKTFHCNIQFPAYSSNSTRVYFFDFENGNQLKFDTIEAIVDPEVLDMMVSNQIVKELTQSAISDKKERLINIILGFIIGALVSALLMFFYMQAKIDSIYESLSFAQELIL